MKIKVSEASSVVLDWMVATCEGGFDLHQRIDWHNKPWAFFFRDEEDPERVDKFYLNEYEPSIDWAQGGPIIEREFMDLETVPCGPASENVKFDTWRAWVNYPDQDAVCATGPTPLIAAMRCYVASKLGDEVEVPDELTTLVK